MTCDPFASLISPAVVSSLGHLPLNVHELRNTKAGRQTLRKMGKAVPEPLTQKYQRKAERRSDSKNRTAPFIGWDGEGMDIDGTHRYTLLANSLGRYVSNPTGLTTWECLDFLTTPETLAETGESLNVMFAGGYDANMMLTDLSLLEVQMLCREGKIRWRNFLIKYRPGRYFKVYRLAEPYYREKTAKRKGGWNISAQCELLDVWGFFQHSFVSALKEWGVGDPNTVDEIEKMKKRRGTFTTQQESEVLGYCQTECQLLSQLCEELRRNFLRVGYIPKSWTGPGALGAAVFDKHKILKYGDRSLAEGVGPVADAALYAYFGGRIEPIQYGRYVGPVFAHDLVSAYPAAMRDLPCLAHGEWGHGGLGSIHHPFSLYHVSHADHHGAKLHPLPHRTHDGRVLFPPTTKGWYWNPEIVASGMNIFTDCDEVWQWRQSCDHHPFAFIDGLFNARRQMKADGNPAQLSLKLVLNSLYGKCCQRLGGEHGAPHYHQIEWAGFITSSCRAQVYSLAMRDPSSVISFETDGVYATAPLIENGDGSLGSWEVTVYDEIVYVTSGLYWLRKGDKWIAKYRGLDNGSLDIEDVRRGWFHGDSHVSASRTRFRGMFTSSITPERFTQWGEWITEDPPPKITLYPAGKRLVLTDADPWQSLQPTMAAQPKSLHSHQHRVPWRNGAFPSQDDADTEGRIELEEGW